jgi:hypothetical protein
LKIIGVSEALDSCDLSINPCQMRTLGQIASNIL